MIYIQPWIQCLGSEGRLFAGSGLSHRRAAARTSHGMEVHGVRHRAVRQIPEVNLNRIANAHPVKGSGHLAVECPVFISRSIGKLAFDFNRFQVDADGLRLAHGDRDRNFGWVPDNIASSRCRVVDDNWTAACYSMIVCRCG